MGGQKSLIHGFGINDSAYPIVHSLSGETTTCPFYKVWINMLHRVYSGRQRTYADASVCAEWRYFSAFRAWMITQDWQGKEIDKDITHPGNKIYSPEYCVFVSCAVNLLLVNNKQRRGKYPLGVCKVKPTGKYSAQCSVRRRSIFLGTYSTPEEASEVYRKFKAQHIMSIALTQENKVFKGLLRHAKILLENSECY